MHQNASLKSLIPIGSRWLPLVPFPLLFVPAHRQLQEEAPPARRAVCFSLVSQNLSEMRFADWHILAPASTTPRLLPQWPKVSLLLAPQRKICTAAGPGHLDAPEHLRTRPVKMLAC